MLSKEMAKRGVGKDPSFRWRGEEITRFEGFSDAVFAFAVTLLIVSLEVPRTFEDLLNTMRGFGAFAICFALLMSVWYRQYTYFRRYRLEDPATITLNAILLFVILFYVYPLKFLFTLVLGGIFGISGTSAVIQADQLPLLMKIYDAGYIAVFLVFALMFHHAYRLRGELELNAIEIHDTLASVWTSLVNAAVGIVSIMIVTIGGPSKAGFAGWVFPLLLGPGLTVTYTILGRRRRLIAGARDPR